jgi:hypothetical protein
VAATPASTQNRLETSCKQRSKTSLPDIDADLQKKDLEHQNEGMRYGV